MVYGDNFSHSGSSAISISLCLSVVFLLSKVELQVMSKLSMAELLGLYIGKDKPAAFLNPNTVLPGKTSLEKLEKLLSSRLLVDRVNVLRSFALFMQKDDVKTVHVFGRRTLYCRSISKNISHCISESFFGNRTRMTLLARHSQ